MARRASGPRPFVSEIRRILVPQRGTNVNTSVTASAWYLFGVAGFVAAIAMEARPSRPSASLCPRGPTPHLILFAGYDPRLRCPAGTNDGLAQYARPSDRREPRRDASLLIEGIGKGWPRRVGSSPMSDRTTAPPIRRDVPRPTFRIAQNWRGFFPVRPP
jgi:hypothetical protein